jgi:hypothetical protein
MIFIAGSIWFFYGVFVQKFISLYCKPINGTIFFDCCNNMITPVVQLEQFKLRGRIVAEKVYKRRCPMGN